MSTSFPSLARLPARALLLALVAGCALALPCAPALAAEKGLQTDLTWGTTAADQQRTAQALDGTGVQWIRLDINWRTTERSRGVYDAGELAMTDHAVELAERAGAKIIMAVSESPEWASGSTAINTPPRDPADFAHFVRDMAARYAGRVAAWEIWNEPNHPRFWNPAPNAAQYAQLLEASYPAVKAGDPSAKVMFAGLAFNDYHYLEDVYAADPSIGDAFDIMATHPYTAGGQSPAVVDRDADGHMTTTSFLAFEEVHRVMLEHGDDRPIWLTEFGWSTNSQLTQPLGGVTEQQQATYLAQAFSLLETIPYVPVAIVYNFRNNYWAGDADNWEDQLGLLRTDFSPKPAYEVFKRYQAPVAVAAPDVPVAVGQASHAPADRGVSVLPLTGTAATPRRSPDVTLSIRRLAGADRSTRAGGRVLLKVVGRVSDATGGKARIVVERRAAGGWVGARSLRASVRSSRFTKRVSITRGARWRISAVYQGGGATAHARPVSVRG